MMFLRHSDQDRIAQDYELSERLGAEILAAGCEPAAPSVPVRSYWVTYERKVNVVAQEVWFEAVVTEVL